MKIRVSKKILWKYVLIKNYCLNNTNKQALNLKLMCNFHGGSRRYIQLLADQFAISSEPFIWVGLLIWNYFILLKISPPSTTSLEKSSVKIGFRDSFPHHTLKLCAWTSLERAFVERENSWPITNWHIILPSLQSMANYKVSCTATKFCYYYSKTNRYLSSIVEIGT